MQRKKLPPSMVQIILYMKFWHNLRKMKLIRFFNAFKRWNPLSQNL